MFKKCATNSNYKVFPHFMFQCPSWSLSSYRLDLSMPIFGFHKRASLFSLLKLLCRLDDSWFSISGLYFNHQFGLFTLLQLFGCFSFWFWNFQLNRPALFHLSMRPLCLFCFSGPRLLSFAPANRKCAFHLSNTSQQLVFASYSTTSWHPENTHKHG